MGIAVEVDDYGAVIELAHSVEHSPPHTVGASIAHGLSVMLANILRRLAQDFWAAR